MLGLGIFKSFVGLGSIFGSAAAAIFGFSGKSQNKNNSQTRTISESSSAEYGELKQNFEKKKLDDEYNRSYLSELDKDLRFILSADSIWGWGDVLRVNKKSDDLESIRKLMDQCREIYVLPKDSLTREQKENYREFVKFNCQWPKTSGRKFKENGLNYVEKSRDINFNFFAPENQRFWSSVENYNKLKNLGSKTNAEKYRFYCDKFPTFKTTEEGYTVEELDYMEFCWSQRLRDK